MKKILITILLLNSLFYAGAQQIKVNWATESKSNNKESIDEIVYDDGTNIYAAVYTITGTNLNPWGRRVMPSIVKFDSKMNPVKRYDYTETASEVIRYQGTYYLGGRLFMVISIYDEKTAMVVVYAQKFNTNLEPDGSKMEILKFAYERGDIVQCPVIFSEDSTKCCIMAVMEYKKQENIKLGIKVYDSGFGQLLEKQDEIKNSGFHTPSGYRCIINNNGDVYFLRKEYISDKQQDEIKSGSGEKIPGYKLVMTKYSTAKSPEETTIETDGKYMAGYFLSSDNAGNPIFISNYEEEYEKGANGIMYFKFDNATGKVISKTKYEIPPALAGRIKQIQNDNIKSKKPAISRDFEVTDFKIYDDMSMAVVLEKNYHTVFKFSTVSTDRTYMLQNYYTTVYSNRNESYEYNNSDGMLVMKLNKEGEEAWCKYIPKMQYYRELKRYIYHSTMFYKDKIYVFYNDLLENETYDIVNAVKAPGRYNGTNTMNLVMVEVDNNGNLEKSIFATTEKIGTNVNPILTRQLHPNRMVLCGYHYKSGVKLGVAEFE